jgi:hypothetical protein
MHFGVYIILGEMKNYGTFWNFEESGMGGWGMIGMINFAWDRICFSAISW